MVTLMKTFLKLCAAVALLTLVAKPALAGDGYRHGGGARGDHHQSHYRHGDRYRPRSERHYYHHYESRPVHYYRPSHGYYYDHGYDDHHHSRRHHDSHDLLAIFGGAILVHEILNY